MLATLSHGVEHVTVWEIDTERRLYEFSLPSISRRVLSFTPDSKYLLTSPDEDALQQGRVVAVLWDMSTGKRARKVADPYPNRPITENILSNVAFSHDGKLAALISRQAPGAPFQLYETEHWSIVDMISVAGETPGVLAFSPDDRILAIGEVSGGLDVLHRGITTNGDIAIFDLARRKLLRKIPAYEATGLAALCFLRDGTLLASAPLGSGKVRRPDGIWKDVVPVDPIRLWNWASGTIFTTYRAKLEQVHALSCDPTSARLATASEDRTVRLWGTHPKSDRAILTFSSPPLAVAFSPDGERIAAAGDDVVVVAEIDRRQ